MTDAVRPLNLVRVVPSAALRPPDFRFCFLPQPPLRLLEATGSVFGWARTPFAPADNCAALSDRRCPSLVSPHVACSDCTFPIAGAGATYCRRYLGSRTDPPPASTIPATCVFSNLPRQSGSWLLALPRCPCVVARRVHVSFLPHDGRVPTSNAGLCRESRRVSQFAARIFQHFHCRFARLPHHFEHSAHPVRKFSTPDYVQAPSVLPPRQRVTSMLHAFYRAVDVFCSENRDEIPMTTSAAISTTIRSCPAAASAFVFGVRS